MKKRALFLGDSNTYGYDPRGWGGGRYPAENRWTDILAASVKDSWEIIPLGQNGRTIPDPVYEKRYYDQLIRDCEPLDLFAVMLGTNDIVLTARPFAGAAVQKMDAFLQYLTSGKHLFRILLIAPPIMPEEAERTPAYRPFARELKKLGPEYRKLAEKYDTFFWDAGTVPLPMAYDFVHLSEKGHQIFSGQMKEYLRTLSCS